MNQRFARTRYVPDEMRALHAEIALQADVVEMGNIVEVYDRDGGGTYLGLVVTEGTLDDNPWPHTWVSVHTGQDGRPVRGNECYQTSAVTQLLLEHNRQS